MKKIIYTAAFACMSAIAIAQSIPNGNFENWTSGTYEYPQYYPFTSNTDAFFRFQAPFNCVKTTDAYQGDYAVELTTNVSATDTVMGHFISGSPNGDNWHGGLAYNQKPTGIRGYYKYNVASADSALIIASFSKAGNNIGMYFLKIGGVKTSYTLFNLTLSPALSETPDSVMFGATSSDINAVSIIPGSTLKLDSVSFTGVTSQPAQINASFELWQSQELNRPDNWNSDRGDGMNRTTDVVAGNYAIELTTYLGDNNGNPQARSSQISNGYYDNSCNCMKGGYPFSNQIDTLVFSYKYVPMGNDSANVSLNFKKNGSNIGWAGISLYATATYQYKEIPFSIGQAPDTVIVLIGSSDWQNSELSFIGSVLKIDEIHFKSQPIIVVKTTPVITWDNPADITYGTLLSATQLNATASVTGTFVYTPDIGAKLDAGNNQTLKVDFTPTDTMYYNSASKTVTINVLAASNVSSLSAADIKVYPNPATDNLIIENLENISSVIVTSIDGTIVRDERLVNSTKASISLSDLSPGLYFVSVRTSSQSITVKKIIVTR
jgi:hypothetical protein